MSDNTKPPFKKEPDRVAGQSTSEHLDQIREKALEGMLGPILASAFAGFEWYRWAFGLPYMPIIFTLLAIGLSVYAWPRFQRKRRHIENLKLGLKGEVYISQHLNKTIRLRGYVLFDDIVGPDFNIDHVAIGPAGIFTIETKTRSKPEKGETVIEYDGEVIHVNGREDRNSLIQAKAQRDWFRRLIADITGEEHFVKPVILFPDWYVKRKTRGEDVWVLHQDGLPGFLDYEQQRLSQKQVAQIRGCLERYLTRD